jgi:hypothetical protein
LFLRCSLAVLVALLLAAVTTLLSVAVNVATESELPPALAAIAANPWLAVVVLTVLVAAVTLVTRGCPPPRQGDRMPNVDEVRWAAFVSDAEDAVSREHMMWLARRGHPGLRVAEWG